jgi:hypothetical protein
LNFEKKEEKSAYFMPFFSDLAIERRLSTLKACQEV